MWYHSILKSPNPNSARARSGRARRAAAGRRPAAGRLRLEALETRCLLSVDLVPSVPAPQLVGEPITWTATVNDLPQAGLVYQFSEGAVNGPFHVVRDFSPANTFTWAPLAEGDYKVKVLVKQGYAATDAEAAVVRDEVGSRVAGADAVITATANPLVALYSAPPASSDGTPAPTKETMHVEFSVQAPDPSWRSTNEAPVEPGKSTNFLIAGMLPNTTYEMRHVLSDGTVSAPELFTTGALPTTLTFPSFTVQQSPGATSDGSQDMIYHNLTKSPSNVANPLATDLQGRVVWYYDVSQAGLVSTWPGQSLVPGGTVLLMGTDATSPAANVRNVLREIDLAGNTIWETNLNAVNAELTALGQENITSFTHDVERLPNGDTAVIGLVENVVNVNGTATNYVGAMVIVLDKNLQVAWTWNAFDHLDVNRGPVLGETLQAGSPQPTAAVPNFPAVDWLHLNAVSWSPADQNLVLSLRHQDWVIKIDYRNGAGDGHVIWRLGQGGDFTVNSTDPNPWFSHQHNAHYVDDTTLVLFDNGNTRYASDPNAHSRGQVWKIDEQTMTATLLVNADMGSYSGALGAAQRLPNGDYSFTVGENGPEPPRPPAHTIEVTPDGTHVYDLRGNRPEYRSYRLGSLYEGTNPPLGGGEATAFSGADPRGQSPVEGAGESVLPGASGATAGSFSDGSSTAAAAASAPAPRLPAPPSTDTGTEAALGAGNVERLDQFFAAGLQDGTTFALPNSTRDLLGPWDGMWATTLAVKRDGNGLEGPFTGVFATDA